MSEKKGFLGGLFGGKKGGSGCCNMEIVEEPEGGSCCGGASEQKAESACCCTGPVETYEADKGDGTGALSTDLDESILFELVDRIEVGEPLRRGSIRFQDVKVRYRYVVVVDDALSAEGREAI